MASRTSFLLRVPSLAIMSLVVVSVFVPTSSGFQVQRRTSLPISASSSVLYSLSSSRHQHRLLAHPLNSNEKDSDSNSSNKPSNNFSKDRREILLKSTSSILVPILSSLPLLPNKANAAKGAAEYDFEYYMLDLFKGNKKEGNVAMSKPPPTPPPRKLTSFIRKIIDLDVDTDSSTGITIQQLSKITSIPTKEIVDQIISFRNKVSASFYRKQPWDVESILDEYYFDLNCYSLYRTAADLIPSNYALRDKWVRDVGKEIYALFKSEGILTAITPSNSNIQLTDTIPSLIQILDTFQSMNLIKGYRLGEKNDDFRTGKNIFDEYDNDDIKSGTNVNLLVSVFRPATLGSSLQITGEGSRFSPDLISPTLAALFEGEINGLRVEYESYFVDEEYRPNPKDFFPEEQLLQITLSKKK
jgi:hypothetical protein